MCVKVGSQGPITSLNRGAKIVDDPIESVAQTNSAVATLPRDVADAKPKRKPAMAQV